MTTYHFAIQGRNASSLEDPTARKRHLCARCGHERKEARKASTLCRDCKAVLTPAELALWGVKPQHRLQPRKAVAA